MTHDPIAEHIPAMLPAPVAALASAALGGAVIDEVGATTGGRSHLTALLSARGRRYALKAARLPAQRADLRREARVLGLLAGRGLPVPALVGCGEDDEWTVNVMVALAGRNGLAVYAEAPDELPQLYGELGRLLAAVHRLRLPADPDLALMARARQVRAALPGLDLPADLGGALAAGLDHPAWQESAGLVHGDPGLHNVLWEGRITGLLDWEWAGGGSPLLDLAWMAWTMRFRALPAAMWESFWHGYSLLPPEAADPATLRALALGQIAMILARTQGQPVAWAEWLRRARWTVDSRW